jgi:hypothetical protein
MANVINATSTGSGGLISTGDDSGVLNIQTNETTALSIDASQIVSFTNAVTAPNISPPVRQTVLYAATDSSGYNALISAGAGLNFNVDATPTNAVLAFANGTADVVTTLTADASNQGTLAASNTNYLTATYSSPSAVTWGSYLVPPQYGYAFDRTQNALLNFEGSNGATTTTDDFGNSWTLTNATITTAQYKFGSSSLDCSGGTQKYASSTSFTTLGSDSFEWSIWFRLSAVPGSGASASIFSIRNGVNNCLSLYLTNTAGTTKLQIFASSAGAGSNDIANGTSGTNTTWTLNQWNKVRFVFDALGGTYKVYLSLNGAAETADITVSSSSRLSSFTALAIGNDASGSNSSQLNGWFDAQRIIRCATNTSTETPSASAPTITDYPVHFFSIPAMTMYYASAASSTAGTNPTLTQTTRLFVGEQDTNATTVTATRNYALKGQYDSGVTTPMIGGSASASKNHNLGLKNATASVSLVNVTAEIGYVPGDEVQIAGTLTTTPYGAPIMPVMRRNSAFFATSLNSTGTIVITASGGAYGLIAVANWGYRIRVKRDF